MRRVVRGGLAFGLLAVLLSGCAAAAGSSAGSVTKDTRPATAVTAAPSSSTVPSPSAPPATQTEAPSSDGRIAAGDLPQGLDAALQRDLGITPEQYLAEAAAAGHASDIAPALAEGGIAPDQVWLDGTTINVHATTASERSLVHSLGATPTTRTPPTGPDVSRPASAYDDLDNGTGWYLPLDGNYISICSTGFNGFASNGAPTVATAGHCLLGNSPVPAAPISAYRYVQSAPNQQGTPGGLIGALAYSSFMFGGGNDAGLIPVTGAGLTPRGQVSNWKGGTVPVRGMKNATVGAPICKSGRTTGWSCGTVYDVNYTVDILNADGSTVTVNSVITSMCMWHGDSGGPAMIGNFAVGINSAGSWSGPSCTDSDGYSTVYPLGGDPDSLTVKQPGWQLQVAIDTPVITSTVGGATPTVSGTVPNATTATSVSLYVDGSSTSAATAPVTADGKWSLAPTGLSTGVHSVSVTATYGSFNRSASSAAAFLPVGVVADRIAGQDRMDTSVEVSRSAFHDGADVVYLAYGWNFPDALVATAAAVKLHGPVLLATSDGISDSVRTEINRLAPKRIVIVGGTAVLSPRLEQSLSGLAPTISRIAGEDRFDTARRIVADAFGATTVSNLYIASGMGFPDSLSAAAAAGASGMPVLTVLGWADTLDAATMTAISALHPAKITIVGGPNSVSAGIASQLSGVASTVRIGGTDRFQTSELVAQSVTATAPSVYVASGMTFPDALTGSVLAGISGKPLLLTGGTCVPRYTTEALAGWHSTAITLVGGLNALSADVAVLSSC